MRDNVLGEENGMVDSYEDRMSAAPSDQAPAAFIAGSDDHSLSHETEHLSPSTSQEAGNADLSPDGRHSTEGSALPLLCARN